MQIIEPSTISDELMYGYQKLLRLLQIAPCKSCCVDDLTRHRHQQDTMLLAALDLAFLSLLVHQIFNLDPETYLVLEGQYLGLAA